MTLMRKQNSWTITLLTLSLLNMTEQEIIELVDTRVDMQTEIIMESSWFQEQVANALKAHLEKQQ